MQKIAISCLSTLTTVLLSATAIAESEGEPTQPERPYEITEEREPCANYQPLRQPLFGDTHVHTALSFDARAQDTRNTPADAYAFAKGDRVGIQPYDEEGSPGRYIQLERPLDFTAVTDHSEFLGEVNICTTEGTDGYWHPGCIAFRHFPALNDILLAAQGLINKERWGFCGEDNEHCFAVQQSVWESMQADAEAAYDRSEECSFTSFIGYEWTSTVGAGINLHRNVIFRNHQVPARPQSWIESPSAVDLWDYLEEECVNGLETCDAVTIPHNQNLSAGLMFESALVQADAVIPDVKLTAEAAARRSRWEPLHEVMQHKGSSECDNRVGWAEDEFCGFEKLPYGSFGAKNTGRFEGGNNDIFAKVLGMEVPEAGPPPAKSYIRWGLKEGLRQQQELGVNGFKFGLISATDTHIAAPGQTSEKGHPGHGGAGMGAREGIKGLPDELEFSPGGLAVVWAEENTRDSVFAAMQRREVYATSGTRPIVRFFAGWDYPETLCDDPEMLSEAYAKGVPMGGDLPAKSSEAPTILVSAMADPGTANDPANPLQRVQVIKGWYEDGELKEQVIDVAGGDNDATVDISTCQTSGNGHKALCTVWKDPDFNADVPAFYYTRILENPSCRWSQYICVEAKVNCEDPSTIGEGLEGCCSPDHQPVIQERAWSSPIWYTPAAEQAAAE